MKRNEPQQIGKIVSEIMKDQHLRTGLDAARIRQAWHETIGDAVSNYTSDISVDGDTVYITLTSSILRNELFMCRSQIIRKLNENMGRPIIQHIILR